MGTHVLCGAVKSWSRDLCGEGCGAATPANSEEGR